MGGGGGGGLGKSLAENNFFQLVLTAVLGHDPTFTFNWAGRNQKGQLISKHFTATYLQPINY